MDNKDTSIPSECQKEYAKLVKPKEVLTLKYRRFLAISKLKNAHYQTLLYYPYLIYKSIRFLNKNGQ